MGSLGSLMFLARDALLAQSGALSITGQNITNASTPGYVRRSPLLTARANTGGAIGGVDFDGIKRNFDRFAEKRVLGESGYLGAAQARQKGLSGLESWLTGDGNVGDRMSQFFSASTDLASNPADPTARSQFLSRAAQIAQAFQSSSDAVANQQAALLEESKQIALEVSERLAKVADLNQRISAAQAMGESAADLRDARDTIVREVGDRIGVQAIEEPNGMLTLLSAGTALVSGAQASSLGVSVSGAGVMRIEVQRPGGAAMDITNRVDSGRLGGLRQARDVDLPKLTANLDQMAFDFATAVNTAHSGGVGLDGVGGRPLFTPPAGVAGAARSLSLDPAMVGQPDFVAASSTAGGLPSGNDVALSLAALSNQALGAGGTPAERYGAFAGQLGNMQVSASEAVMMREATVGMAQNMKEQASGVSVEEEMVDLSRYQRAFEASMRVLKVADELLEGLIREV